MLAAALVSQYGFGLWPCPLCLWQRWPHLAAVAAGALALALPGRLLPVAGGLAALATAAIGGYHAGVEYGWWLGLESCAAGPGITGIAVETLLDPGAAIAAAPRCDQAPFRFLALSLAGWNMLASLALAAVWAAAAMRPAAR
jgi:disulfide bond formation protein DsbB